MKISIIVPIYNAEKTLKVALDSALRQTVTPKEIICIDDGSTDRTVEILEDYAKNNREIKLYHQSNSGSGVARNLGMSHAQGKFICFLDADDYYIESDALETMVEICENKNLNICGSLRRYIEPKDGRVYEHPLHREYIKAHPNGGLIKYIDYQDDYHYQSYVFRKIIIDENGIEFPPYRRYQDPVFFLKAMIVAEIFWVCPKELYCYRRNTRKSLESKMVIKDLVKGINDVLECCEEYKLDALKKKVNYRMEKDFHKELMSYNKD